MSHVRSVGVVDASGRSREINLDDWRDATLYSSIEMDVVTNLKERMIFFGYATGQRIPQVRAAVGSVLTPRNSDPRDTNFSSTGGALSSTREFAVYTMWIDVCALSNDAQAASGGGLNNRASAPLVSGFNLQWLQFSSIFSLIFGEGTEKAYFQAPPADWPPQTGVLGYTSGDSPGGPQIAVGTMGMSGGRMLRRTRTPIWVDSRQKIVGLVEFPRGAVVEVADANTPALAYTQAMKITMFIRGLGKFPVVGSAT
jgi:hypothetical protein